MADGLRYGFDSTIGMIDAPEALPAGGSRKMDISDGLTFEFGFVARCPA